MRQRICLRGLCAGAGLWLAAGFALPAGAVTVQDGSAFRVDFDATSSEGEVSSVLDIAVDAVSATVFTLFVKVTNDTGISPGTSFSAFGFSLNPDAINLTSANPAAGDFADDQDGLDWKMNRRFVPGSGVRVEHCVGTGILCQSANEGLAAGLVDRLALTLTFDSAVTRFNISNFAGRFARIGTDDDSLGIRGTLMPIPLPATLPLFLAAIGGLGVMGWRRGAAAATA